jgi:hypothetical protein
MTDSFVIYLFSLFFEPIVMFVQIVVLYPLFSSDLDGTIP